VARVSGMGEGQPALRQTEPATLVAAGLAAAAVGWLLISNLYRNMPPLGWPPVIIIGSLAVLEAALARHTWVRVHRRGGAAPARPARMPLEPLLVARFAVLAKASSLGGALFGGFFAGLLPWLAIEAGRVSSAAADLPPGVTGLVASAALVAAALWLERACRVPEADRGADGDEPDGRSGG
jgi:hypothetical protein